MDVAYISALSALAGSAIGALSSGMTTWLTQSNAARQQRAQHEQTRQEALYVDFIDEASRLYADALANPLQNAATLVKLYSLVSRMRLFAPTAIVKAADDVVEKLIATYFDDNLSPAELRERIERGHADPLRAFSEVCRSALMSGLR